MKHDRIMGDEVEGEEKKKKKPRPKLGRRGAVDSDLPAFLLGATTAGTASILGSSSPSRSQRRCLSPEPVAVSCTIRGIYALCCPLLQSIMFDLLPLCPHRSKASWRDYDSFCWITA